MFFFFFSSRRRHTRCGRDWSSDVCSSDLGSETTESSRATQLLEEAFPTRFADYVAIVVHGPVRWTNPRFEAVLDTLKAVVERRSYVGEVISARSIGESSFVSQDRRTTFLIAALTPESTHDLSAS